jgi:AraC-type DNA-binding domain-containing proteins
MNDIPWFIQNQNNFGMNTLFYVDHLSITRHFPLHRHDFIEIEFVISGEGKNIINGVEYELRPGSISLLLPWHSHEITPDDGKPLDLFKCSFGTEFLVGNNTFYELNDMISKSLLLPPVAALNSSDTTKVNMIFGELLQEYTDLNLWKESLIRAKITEILIYFDRCRKASHYSVDERRKELNVWEVMEYIHSSFNKEITLVEVSEKFHYNASYLNKQLKKQIGLDFDGILQEVRVRNACTLLAYPVVSINEVANIVGYKSRGLFFRAFRNVKGMSPENYRKLNFSNNNYTSKPTMHTVLNAQIIYYLHLHYSEDITLSSLAKEFHYNESYLSEILVQNGVNFVSLLHEIRIYHACALLLTTDTAINEIGFNVGFDSPITFSHVFKKLKGISPGEYRKSNRCKDMKSNNKKTDQSSGTAPL